MTIQTATQRRVLGIALLVLIAFCKLAEATAQVRWRSVPTHGAESGLTSIAFDPSRGRIATGSTRGLYAGDAGGVFDLVEGRSEVRDLAFRGGGSGASMLFAATSRGIYRFSADGSAGPIAPGPAEGARDVQRIAVARRGAAVAVATTDGAFFSWDGEHWDRLSPTHPTGPVTAVALRVHGEGESGFECFTLAGGALWRTLVTGPEERSVARTERETIPFAPREDARDVVTELPGGDVVIVYESALAVHPDGFDGPGSGAPGSGTPSSGTPSSATQGWKILRPTLPPGARIARIAAALGRFWLATDRGLLEADQLAGPWRRAGAPAGSADVRALAGDAESLYVASETRLLQAELVGAGALRASSAGVVLLPDSEPRVQDLHRAAIAHLSLSRGRFDAMQSRVGRRGWLPVVSIRGDYGTDKGWGTDYDQTFTSGSFHDLVDRSNDHGVGAGVSVALAWDLGDVVYHPEEIDVSREVRTQLAFRDDVLDELTQLYFDRKRVLVQRAGLPENSAEAQQLQLRADELAAGMDAWTGGWFTRAIGGSAP